MDMTKITEVLRKNVLTCILLGMRTSLRHLHSSRAQHPGRGSEPGPMAGMSDDEYREAGTSWEQFESLMKRRKLSVKTYESDMETDHDSELEDAIFIENVSANGDELEDPLSPEESGFRISVESDFSADVSSIPSADLSASAFLAAPSDMDSPKLSESANIEQQQQRQKKTSTQPHKRPSRRSRADQFLRPLFEADFKQVELLKLLPSQLEKATGENEQLTRSLGLFASSFIFRTLSPRVFHNLRVLAGVTERRYYDALNPVVFLAQAADTIRSSEGRSGSFFCFSPDRRLILKTVPEAEFSQLFKSLRYYYNHIDYHRNSILMRILGAHSIKMSNSSSLYVIVMENMFSNPATPIHEIYDLKGSWIDRGEPAANGHDEVSTDRASGARKVLFLPIQLVAGGLKQIGTMLSGGGGESRGIRIKKDREVARAFQVGQANAEPLLEQLCAIFITFYYYIC